MIQKTLTYKTLKKTKSKSLTYSFIIAVVICLMSFLPYIHDFNYFNGKEGFSGFSSLRIAIYIIAIFLFGISGWVFAFINSKGKDYRIAILAPILMGVFQLFIYILDSRKTDFNAFNTKVVLNFSLILIITFIYYRLRKRE